MKRKLILITLALLLSGCKSQSTPPYERTATASNAIANDGAEETKEDYSDIPRLTTFGTDLPTIAVDGVDFKIGVPADERMYDIIKPFYVNEDQYASDVDAKLLSYEGRAEYGKDLTPEDEAFYAYDNMTRIVFGGQKTTGGFLAFTATNLSAEAQNIKDCPIISVSFMYDDDLKDRITVNGKKLLTKDDMISLMGENYIYQDVRESNYIYTDRYSYTMESTADVTFLIDENDEIIGIQEGDFYYYMLYQQLFGGVE